MTTTFFTFLGLVLFRVGLLGFGGLALSRLPWFRRRRVYGLEVPPGQIRSELRYGVVILVFDAVFQPSLLASGLGQFAEVSLASVMVPLVVGFMVNEVWFYVSHRLLHTRALYFIHAQHHVARVAEPMTTVSFSLAEHVLAFVPVNLALALCSNVMPVSLPGLAAFGLLTELGNLYGHLNVELLPAGFARTLPGRVFNAPTFHAMHHARYTGHYGLFTRVIDRLLGTEFDDYASLQQRTASGQPLGSLAERGVADAEALTMPGRAR